MKRPNISSGNWQAKLHRDMTPPRTKVETRDAVICDTLGNEADAIACAAVPDLLEALEPFAAYFSGDLANVGGGTCVSPSFTVQQFKDARAALLKAGYTF